MTENVRDAQTDKGLHHKKNYSPDCDFLFKTIDNNLKQGVSQPPNNLQRPV